MNDRAVAVCMVGDGRIHYLADAVASLRDNVDYPFVARIMVDDSGDPKVRGYLERTYPDFDLVSHPRRRGAMIAVRSAWRAALRTGADYIFHTEEDFIYNEPVDIDRLADLLDGHPDIAQVVLKRDPYSRQEHDAGGYMELYPDRYDERTCEHGVWCEHGRLFSSNPSLIPRKVLRLGRFSGETTFGQRCVANGYRFAYWGAKTDPPRVTHIGVERSVQWRQ